MCSTFLPAPVLLFPEIHLCILYSSLSLLTEGAGMLSVHFVLKNCTQTLKQKTCVNNEVDKVDTHCLRLEL